MDKRIQSTRSLLQNSLRGLLGNKHWDKINVNSLCKDAGISRSTFYSHFDNKESLLDSLLGEFEQAMLADNNNRGLRKTGSLKFLPLLTIHVSSNREVFSATNRIPGNTVVAQRFQAMIYKLTLFEINEAYGKLDDNVIAFIAGGIYNSLVTWSMFSKETTHLQLLKSIDDQVRKLLPP